MVMFLSEEWFADELAVLGALPVVPGVGVAVEITVAGGPDGDVLVHQVVDDGVLTAAGLGRGPGDPDAELTVPWEDAVAIVRGNLDPHVSYMRGRTKLKGSMPPVLIHLRPVTGGDDFASAWSDLMSRTELS